MEKHLRANTASLRLLIVIVSVGIVYFAASGAQQKSDYQRFKDAQIDFNEKTKNLMKAVLDPDPKDPKSSEKAIKALRAMVGK